MTGTDPAIEIDQTMRESFERLEKARRYRRWILEQVEPWLGSRVLEVGCGFGNFTAELLRNHEVVAVDVEQPYIDVLEQRLSGRPGLTTEVGALGDSELVNRLEGRALDSAVLLNVLEHIDDDVRALRDLTSILEPASTVVIQVPAHSWLYGEADRALGHVRRYDRRQLEGVIERSGMHIERSWQFNTLGVLGWFVSGRVRRQTMFSNRRLWLYEALVPIQRALEPARGVPLGLSLMAVASTPR